MLLVQSNIPFALTMLFSVVGFMFAQLLGTHLIAHETSAIQSGSRDIKAP